MADLTRSTTEADPRIHLAQEADFGLGALQVSPSACQIRYGDRESRVEPRVMEVLVHLVRHAGRTVTRDELIEACWSGRFVSDDAVARVIAKVRDLARGVEPAPFVIETVPRIGFRLKPQFQVEPTRGEAATAPRAGRRRLAVMAALALAALAAGAVAAWRFAGPLLASPDGRVEVMRFEPLQADPALQRFSMALGDSVVRMLAGSGVKTAGRPLPRDEAPAPGKAEFRVAGTVDRDGETYVVNAQVIDRATGDVLWSGRIARPTGSPEGFHEEAANKISDVLHCAVTHRAASNRPVGRAAFGLLLSACDRRRTKHPGELTDFMQVTRRLAREAPDLSIAHSLHGVALAFVATAADRAQPERAAALRREAQSEAERALRLDPRNGEAHLALALSKGFGMNWLERERLYLRAAELSPDLSIVRNNYVSVLREVGRLTEARELNRLSVASDPFSPFQLSNLTAMAAMAGDLDEADTLLDRLALLDRETADNRRIQVMLWWSPPAEASAALQALARDRRSPEGAACFDAHYAAVTRAASGPVRGLPRSCDNLQRDMRVRMLARQGDVDGAFRELETRQALNGGTISLFFPEMASVRRDPRFMALAKEFGLVAYWTQSGKWPDFCREPDLPYDCRKAAAALLS